MSSHEWPLFSANKRPRSANKRPRLGPNCSTRSPDWIPRDGYRVPNEWQHSNTITTKTSAEWQSPVCLPVLGRSWRLPRGSRNWPDSSAWSVRAHARRTSNNLKRGGRARRKGPAIWTGYRR